MNNHDWKCQIAYISSMTICFLSQGMAWVFAEGNPDSDTVPHNSPGMPPVESGIFDPMIADRLICVMILAGIILALALILMYRLQAQKIRRVEKQNWSILKEVQGLRDQLFGMKDTQNSEMESSGGWASDVIAEGRRVQQERQTAREQMEREQMRQKADIPVARAADNHYEQSVSSGWDVFLSEYNQFTTEGLTGFAMKQAREAMIAKYHIRSFSCRNAADRAYQPTLEPDYQSVDQGSSGDYWALPISGQTNYCVVPNPKITYEAQIHGSGGMKEAFASNYHGGSFGHIRVSWPAIFSMVNNHWSIVRPGKVEVY